MRYRKQSLTGDYTFGSGQANFYRDEPNAVAQAVKTRLQLWVGEWFLDTDEGTLYFQGVLGKYSLETANITIQQRVLGTQGIVNYENYQSSLNANTRGMTARFTVNTIYSVTSVPVEIPITPMGDYLTTEGGLIIDTESGEGILL